MQTVKKVIVKIELETVNRGTKLFLVTTNGKGYFANEVGELTSFAKVTGTDDRTAHRINPSIRYGNQYTSSWKPKPYTNINEAIQAVNKHAQTMVQYF